MSVVLYPGGPRSVLLVEQAYRDEGLACPEIDERVSPVRLLYPRSFVEAIAVLPDVKRHDYAFIGGLYRPETHSNRRWILDYARRRFSDRSYFLVTDPPGDYEPLGRFDRTGIDDDVVIPKELAPGDRGFFHRHYFEVLRQSEFTLCPAGDLPWSMRFSEAIMCRSIPVVSDLRHTGRNDLERSIGYEVVLADDRHTYDPRIAASNYELFLEHQTLMGSSPP